MAAEPPVAGGLEHETVAASVFEEAVTISVADGGTSRHPA